MAPRFPVEIFDHFIDALWDLQTSTSGAPLSECSLVSRSFARRARQLTFAQVRLLYVADRLLERAEKFYELLTFSSGNSREGSLLNVALMIKGFSVYCPHHRNKSNSSSLENAFSAIIQALHGPEHGITSFFIFLTGEWATLGLAFRHAVCDLLRSPTLNSLKISAQHIPKTLLIGSHITNLTLQDCSISPVDIPRHYSSRYPSDKNTAPALNSLLLEYFNSPPVEGIEQLLQHSLSRLRKASVDVQFGQNHLSLAYLLSQTKNTLETLTIQYSDNSDGIDSDTLAHYPLPLNLASMKELKCIKLSYLSNGNDMWWVSAPDQFNLFLGAVTAVPTSLQVLDLDIAFDLNEIGLECPQLTQFLQYLSGPQESSSWSRLNTVLSTQFRTLSEVVLKFGFDTYKPLELESKRDFQNHVEALVINALPYFSDPQHLTTLQVVTQCDIED